MRKLVAGAVGLGLVLAGALASAHEDHGAKVSEVARAESAAESHPSIGSSHGKAVSAEAMNNEDHQQQAASGGTATVVPDVAAAVEDVIAAPVPDTQVVTGTVRPENHGSFVSDAARCEDVTDGTTTFTAPDPCEGSDRGQYVSSVARSDLGKPEPGEDDDEEEEEEEPIPHPVPVVTAPPLGPLAPGS